MNATPNPTVRRRCSHAWRKLEWNQRATYTTLMNATVRITVPRRKHTYEESRSETKRYNLQHADECVRFESYESGRGARQQESWSETRRYNLHHLMNAYGTNPTKAEEVLIRMEKAEVKPNDRTYNTRWTRTVLILKSGGGVETHGESRVKPDLTTYNIWWIVRRDPQRHTNTSTKCFVWNLNPTNTSPIVAHALKRDTNIQNILEQMKTYNIEPDDIIFTICAHAHYTDPDSFWNGLDMLCNTMKICGPSSRIFHPWLRTILENKGLADLDRSSWFSSRFDVSIFCKVESGNLDRGTEQPPWNDLSQSSDRNLLYSNSPASNGSLGHRVSTVWVSSSMVSPSLETCTFTLENVQTNNR